MKNLYLLPTQNNNSKLASYVYDESNNIKIGEIWLKLDNSSGWSNCWSPIELYIVSNEEIKEGDWFFNRNFTDVHKCIEIDSNGDLLYNRINRIVSKHAKKIILTTDDSLIKDGVGGIWDDFLKFFVKNPSCEEVEVKEDEQGWFVNGGKDIEYRKYKYIEIPKVEHKQESLTEASKRESQLGEYDRSLESIRENYFIKGAKWQQEAIIKLLKDNDYQNEPVFDLLTEYFKKK